MTEHTQDDGVDAFVARIAPPLRAAERLDDSFEARVMLAVEAPAAGRAPTREMGWWRRPRTITLSPLGGLAMAAGIAGLVMLGGRAGRAIGPSGTAMAPVTREIAATAPDTVHMVRFVFVDPGAHAVSLVGDFNAWEKGAAPLVEAGASGLWTVSVPVPPGRHQYAFVVRRDGSETWVADPFAATVRDDFRTESSVITVSEARGTPAAPRSS